MLRKLEKLVESIGAILLLGMVITVLLQVIYRYILKISAPWTEEFARMFYIYLVFLMMPILEAKNRQLRVDIVYNLFPRLVKMLVFFTTNIACLIFLVLLFIGCVKMMVSSWQLVFASVRWLKSGLQYLPLVISIPLSVLCIILRMVNYKSFSLLLKSR